MIDEEHVLQLIGSEIKGLITEEEKAELDAIIAADPEARLLWQQMHAVLGDPAVKEALHASTGPQALERLKGRLQKRSKVLFLRRLVSAAAIIVLASGIAYFLGPTSQEATSIVTGHSASPGIELILPDGRSISLSERMADSTLRIGDQTLQASGSSLEVPATSEGPVQYATLKVPVGKDFYLRLPDQTEVWLNATTTIRFPLQMTAALREVYLNGEAYLKVAHQETQPFVVNMPRASVRVLGTEFNVNSYDSADIQVALVEGSIQMLTASDSVKLAPGNMGSYKAGQHNILIGSFDANDLLGWRQGIYYFNETPLAEVFEVVLRWYGIKVVIDNDVTGQKRFTGAINRNRPISESLEGLKEMRILDYYFDQDSVLHIK